MKYQYKKRILTGAALAMALIMVSCSRQTGSIAHLKKLDNLQALTADNIKVNSHPKDVINKSLIQPIAITSPPTPINSKENYLQPVPVKKSTPILSQISPKHFAKAIQNQAAAIRNLYSGRHVSSHSQTFDTGGFLGLAILCLIAAVVLAYLGFHGLAALLWVIGIILLAAAILFFILWLIGRAVVDSD